jgi:hypothetical protein
MCDGLVGAKPIPNLSRPEQRERSTESRPERPEESGEKAAPGHEEERASTAPSRKAAETRRVTPGNKKVGLPA